jgi:dephospho-CoA kinase
VNIAPLRTPNNPPLHFPAGREYLAVGVTGGIGSGKSALCDAFAALGRFVLSGDRIARELTAHDPRIREEIVTAFGSGVLAQSGGLDRKALAEIVFHDRLAREKLNGIIHPRVFAALEAILMSEPPERLRPYVIHEAALIYETGMDRELNYVIVVDAPEEERIRRVMLRDACSREEVESRIASQMPVPAKRARADFLVENTGEREALAGQAAFLDTLLSTMAERMRRREQARHT